MKLSTLLVISAFVATFCVLQAEARFGERRLARFGGRRLARFGERRLGWMDAPGNMALDQDDENVGYRPPRHRPGQSWQQARKPRLMSWHRLQQASQGEDDGVMFDEEDEWVGVSKRHCCAISGHPICCYR